MFMVGNRVAMLVTVLLAVATVAQPAAAQESSSAQQAQTPEIREAAVAQSAIVRFRGADLFTVRAPIGAFSVVQRAQAVEDRLGKALAQSDLNGQSLRVESTARSSDIFLGSQFITSVTDADSAPLGRSRAQQAADMGLVLQRVVQSDLDGRSVRSLLLGAIRSAIAIVVAVAAIFLIRWALDRAAHFLTGLARRSIPVIRFAGFTLFSPSHAIPLTLRALKGLRWLLALIAIIIAAEVILSQFPWTQGIAGAATRSTLVAVRWVFGGIVAFVPKILYLALIVFVTRYLLRGLRFVLARWGAAEAVSGFPSEWVRPTYQIVRFIVIALALVVAFPYLPGSDSKAFQGVSVFVGLLVSLGSASAIGNMVAGIVLIYMRAVKVGDRVKIADATGDVISCDLLALKLRTIKNVDIAIPNGLVLSNHIINFSAQAREGRLILHTSVTIGYDAPWKTVHELLIAAALATPDIEATPEPFVLQTSLDDFYVGYEINAYTKKAQGMTRIYSDLHASIQDKFNEGGVEILSPHYGAMRDGSRTAVPDRYLPKDYQPATFGVSLFRSKPGVP